MNKSRAKSSLANSQGVSNGHPPTISVINYNNPTINMNFNESGKPKSRPGSNFLTSPMAGAKSAYEDHDFYESLNYSKLGNQFVSPQQ